MSDMKCPFCRKKLQLALNVDGREFYWCENYDCDGVNYGVGNKELWQKLIRTRKALDVAVDALKSAHKYYQNCVIREKQPQEINWYYIAMNMDIDIFKALEQITALEQKE